MQALETLFSHQSVRHYLKQEVEKEKVEKIKRAIRQSSSTCFFQIVTTIRITDKELLGKIGEISGGTMRLAQAPELWLFCLDFTKLLRTTDLKLPIPFDLFFAGINDTSICCQSALVAAESQGLSCVIVGGIKRSLSELCAFLNLPQGVAPVVGLCLGYGDPEFFEQQKPRMPESWTFMENTYQDNFNEVELDSYNQEMFDYYVSRKTNNKGQTWSEAAQEMLAKQPKVSALIELYKKQGISFE